jgi:hypothetical protein
MHAELFAAMQYSEEAQEILLREELDVQELAEVLLPMIGADPEEWPQWSEAIIAAGLAYLEDNHPQRLIERS